MLSGGRCSLSPEGRQAAIVLFVERFPATQVDELNAQLVHVGIMHQDYFDQQVIDSPVPLTSDGWLYLIATSYKARVDNDLLVETLLCLDEACLAIAPKTVVQERWLNLLADIFNVGMVAMGDHNHVNDDYDKADTTYSQNLNAAFIALYNHL